MTSAQSLDTSTSAKTWRLSAFIDKAGRHYIYAYWNQWDPVKKQSRNGATRSVGRILEDGRVRFSPKFLADHPEYAEGVWVYQGNQLISTSEEDLKKDMAEQGYAYRCDALHVGVTYGLWVMACQRGIYQDLQSVFGALQFFWGKFRVSTDPCQYSVNGVYLPACSRLNRLPGKAALSLSAKYSKS